MIRTSNQLSPKTKVVDLLFLYNFYFGQIPSFYMKFGVSAGQIWVKIVQTSKQWFSSASTVQPRRHTGVWPPVSDATRRPSRLDAAQARAYRLPEPSPFSPRPYASSSSRESSPCSATAGPRTGRSSPPHLNPSHSESLHLAPNLLRQDLKANAVESANLRAS